MSENNSSPNPAAVDDAAEPSASPPAAAPMDIMEMLRKLVNDSPNVITDVNGKSYPLPAQLSTKAMYRLGEAIREFYGKLGAQGQAQLASNDGWMGKIGVIADLVMGDQAYLTIVENAFKVAHPKITTEAVAALKAQAGDDAAEDITVSDCFSLEELLGVGLLPFLLRVPVRLWGAAETAGVMRAGASAQ
jgi:hypothetical protein